VPAPLTELVERLADRLLPSQDRLEEVTVLLDPGQHDVHRVVERIELLVHLAPPEWRRNRRALTRSHRVDGGDRLPLPVLVRVDEDPAPLLLRPFRRNEATMRPLEC